MHKLDARFLFCIILLLASGAASAATASSTFPVFWVAGDPTGIGNTFQFMASMFGNGTQSESVMAGGMLAAAAVGLLLAMMASAFKQQFLIGQWFVATVVAIFMFIPTTSITVMSFFDETSAMVSPRMVVVDNVPVGIAYPAGMASFAAKAVSDKFMTWFSTGDNDAQTAGALGLMNPLKMLLTMRDMYDCKNPGDSGMLCTNLASFMQYCPGLNPKISSAATADAGYGIVLNDNTINGTVDWHTLDTTSSTGDDVSYIPCRQAGPQIYSAMVNYFSSGQFGADLSRNAALSNPGAATTGDATGDAAAAAVQGQAVLAKLQNVLGSAQAEENDIGAALVFPAIQAAAIESRAADSPLHASLMFAKSMENARNKAALDQAAQGSMFVSFMTTAMNFFTFLFVATACIVVMLAMVMGTNGIKIYGSWLLFGLWSQSWLPLATLVSYYTEYSFWQRLTDLGNTSQLAPVNISRFFDQVSSVIYTGSVMMSSVPIITLSLLSGSVVAMSSLAGKATGTDRDYGDSGQFGGTESGRDANVTGLTKTTLDAGGFVSAAGGISAAGLMTGGARSGMLTLSTADSVREQHAASEAAKRTVQAAKSQLETDQAALEHAKQHADEHKSNSSVGSSDDKVVVNNRTNKNSNTNAHRDQNQVAWRSSISGSTSFEMATPKQLPMGVDVKMSYEADRTSSNASGDESTRVRGSEASNSNSKSHADKISNDVSTGNSDSDSVRTAQSRVDASQAQLSRAEAYEKAVTSSYESAKSVGTDMSANVGDLAMNANKNHSAGENASAAMMEARLAGGDAAANAINNDVMAHGGWGNEVAVGNALSKAVRSSDMEMQSAGLGAAAALAKNADQEALGVAIEGDISFKKQVFAFEAQDHGLLKTLGKEGGNLKRPSVDHHSMPNV